MGEKEEGTGGKEREIINTRGRQGMCRLHIRPVGIDITGKEREWLRACRYRTSPA